MRFIDMNEQKCVNYVKTNGFIVILKINWNSIPKSIQTHLQSNSLQWLN